MKKVSLLVLLLPALLVAIPVHIRAEEAEEAHHREAPEHRHSLELLLGNSTSDGEHGFSAGLGYEYRLSDMFGVGGFAERAAGDFREWIFGLPLLLHPYKGLRFLAAPGIDVETEEGDSEFLFRVGVAYEFEIHERWSFIPAFNVDFVDGEEVLVYGLSFGYAF